MILNGVIALMLSGPCVTLTVRLLSPTTHDLHHHFEMTRSRVSARASSANAPPLCFTPAPRYCNFCVPWP